MIWNVLNIVLKSRSCVRDAAADGSRRWISGAVDVDIVENFSQHILLVLQLQFRNFHA